MIGILFLIAASVGLLYQFADEPYPYTNHRGELVMINRQGLYYCDTVSMAAQAQANDLITLVLVSTLQSFSEQLSLLHRQKENWTGINACPVD